MKSGETVVWLGTPGTYEQHGDEFPECPFVQGIPDLEMLTGKDKKQQQKPVTSNQRTRKEVDY